MKVRWAWFLVPCVLVSVGLLVASQFIFVRTSFFHDLGFGRVGKELTLANYFSVFKDPFYINSLVLTAKISLIVVIWSMVIGYPVAYILARMRSRWGPILLAGAVVTTLVTQVIKVLGFVIIFSADGPVNRFLMGTGIIGQPIKLLGTVSGVVVGQLHYTLSFIILLFFSVIQTIPRSLEEAARILGANPWRVFWRVLMPLSLPGIIAGSLVVFNLTMGAFTAAALLGGGRVLTLPVLIQRTMILETKYATAATLSAVLLAAVLMINVISILMVSRLRMGRPASQ
jgi:putative spermidine/putrescine transport system permease protein